MPSLRPRRATPRLIIAAAVVIVVIAAGAIWLTSGSSSSTPAPALATATVGTLRPSVSATGTIAAGQQANLEFGTAGRVAAVDATVGQQVGAGSELARIDSPALPSQVAQAKAAVAADVAKAAADRSAGASSAQVNADDAATASAQAQQAVAEQSLSEATLTAPFAGTVAAVNVTVGQQLASGGSSGGGSAGSGSGAGTAAAPGAASGSGSGSSASSSASATSAAVVLVGTGSDVVDATVDDTEVGQIKAGDKATIVPNGSTTPVDGTVTSVGLVATQTSGVASYPVTIAVDGVPPGLHIGAGATVSIVVAELDDVLLVPSAAVHPDGSTSAVTVIDNGRQVSRPVTVGTSANGRTQITGGLTAGTQVVLPDAAGATGTGAGRGGFGGFGGGGLGGGRGGGGGGGGTRGGGAGNPGGGA